MSQNLPPEAMGIVQIVAAGLAGSKPITKLIEQIGSAIGVIYKPTAIRREAKARADELGIMSIAESNAMLIKNSAESEIADRTRHRLFKHEISRQARLENIFKKSVSHLDDEVSDEPVDEEWKNRFFTNAQDVSNEDVQELWAKILANEVNHPGNVSLRTLDILRNITAKEAEIFNKVSSLCNYHGVIFKTGDLMTRDLDNLTDSGITFSDIQLLRHVGLMENSDNAAILFQERDFKKLEDFNIIVLDYGEYQIVFGKKDNLPFELQSFSLSQSGNELLKIFGRKVNYKYLEKLNYRLNQRGFSTRIDDLRDTDNT
jgi:uncharacterized repeat protein (TIGR03899 family)